MTLPAPAEALRAYGVFQVTKFADDEAFKLNQPYSIGEPFSNALVNLGMEEIWKLATGQGGTAFSNANARLGVGTGTAAVNVAQTDLQGVTTTRKAMDATFPSAPAAGVEVWRATFGGSEHNAAWEEFAVFNAAVAGVMMNRSLSSQGTKASGQTWQLTYTITLS